MRLPEEREGKKCHVSWLLIHSRTSLCEIMGRAGVRIFGKPLGVSHVRETSTRCDEMLEETQNITCGLCTCGVHTATAHLG